MDAKRYLGVGLLALANTVAAEDEVSATPYRPSVANPAELSAPGWLEVELGVARSRGGENRWQDNQPYTLKYAFSRDFGVLLGGDFRVSQVDAAGQKTTGRGDNTLLLKHRFAAGEGSAFGLEWGAKLNTAAPDIGSGHTDYIVNGIYSVDIGTVRVDANLGVTRFGLQESGLGRSQYNWALSTSKEVVPKWTLAAELSGTARKGANPYSQFLTAASYAVNRKVVVDFGAATGIGRTAPDWSAFTGVTWLMSSF